MNPSHPDPRKICLQVLRCELRHEEIHVVSDSIANSMTGHSHTIQAGYKVIAALDRQCVCDFERLLEQRRTRFVRGCEAKVYAVQKAPNL
jgi:hypothetical protein